MDIRTPSKGYEEFYDKLLREDVHFIRGRAAEVTDWTMTAKEEGKLVIRAEDTLIGTVRRIPVDMVVLSVGLEARADADDAVLVGLSVSAAVEFSFLLGLGTLGAATAYEALKNGSLLVDSYGGAEIVIGLVVAFITAAVAITWMVRWLERRSLAIFGWYRLAIAGVGAVLLLTGTITSTPG